MSIYLQALVCMEHCLFIQIFGGELGPVPVSKSTLVYAYMNIFWTSVELPILTGLEQETRSRTEAYRIHSLLKNFRKENNLLPYAFFCA